MNKIALLIHSTIFLLLWSNNAFSADFGITSDEVISEPRFELTLLPGLIRPARKPLAMHMVEQSDHNENLLNLNSSLVKPTKIIETEKYFDDIEVTNNNIFELKF